MIRYTLICTHGHTFEGWFRSSQDFDDQQRATLLACPHCGVHHVEKQLMTPGITGTAETPGPTTTLVKSDPTDVTMRQMLRDMRQHILSNSEDVGPRFAEEARRIHYQEAEHRSIRGQATPSEAKALLDDGIEIAPLPILPEDLM